MNKVPRQCLHIFRDCCFVYEDGRHCDARALYYLEWFRACKKHKKHATRATRKKFEEW